jgi:hypothetical protein
MAKKHQITTRKTPPPSQRARRNTRQGSPHPHPDSSPASSIEEVTTKKETPEEELSEWILDCWSSMS